MRLRPLASLGLLALGLSSSAQTTSCTGLCLQQVSCPAGQSTTITGKVYAPNGVDPLPDIIVFIPNGPVAPFTPGVSCPVPGTPPSGNPLVGTTTAVDGSFQITNAPVGAGIPLIIQTGRWRRQLVVPVTTACADTAFSTRMPQNQSEGDIPKFAIATGKADSVECVLRKVGLSDSEFTDPSGTGRINLFTDAGGPGAQISSSTPGEIDLLGTLSTLNQYDVLMLPCEGGTYPGNKNAAEYANIVSFANSGGRIYSSHFSYQWYFQNPPFDTTANWLGSSTPIGDGLLATVDTSFSGSATLGNWLSIVGAGSGTPPAVSIALSAVKHDLAGVNPPTQSWLRLDQPIGTDTSPVEQLVFNTPIGAANQCGRVLFNEYHVEDPPYSTSGLTFPAECNSGATMTPQEKLLEYSLFELTADGSGPTLTPVTQDFGSQPVGFQSAPPKTFAFTNNSTFPIAVSAVATTGDFVITANGCNITVPGGGTCTIAVAFAPTVLGARTGTLNVTANANTITSSLTGNGVGDFSVSSSSLSFGNVDVGATATQALTITNNASGFVSVPRFVLTGDFSATSNCGSSLSPLASCTVTVTFQPTTTGARTGSLAVNSASAAYAAFPVSLSGNGVDFSVAVSPSSASLIAGYKTTFTLLTTPIAGFLAPVTVTCVTTAPASTCTPAAIALTPSAATSTVVTVTTISQYTVVGYGGIGAPGLLALLGVLSAALLWVTRRRSGPLRAGLWIALAAVGALSVSGCSGKYPSQNPSYTPPGTYTYTVSVTDGFLTHAAVYTLTVTAR